KCLSIVKNLYYVVNFQLSENYCGNIEKKATVEMIGIENINDMPINVNVVMISFISAGTSTNRYKKIKTTPNKVIATIIIAGTSISFIASAGAIFTKPNTTKIIGMISLINTHMKHFCCIENLSSGFSFSRSIDILKIIAMGNTESATAAAKKCILKIITSV